MYIYIYIYIYIYETNNYKHIVWQTNNLILLIILSQSELLLIKYALIKYVIKN